MADRKTHAVSGKADAKTIKAVPPAAAPLKKGRVMTDAAMRDADVARMKASDKIAGAMPHNKNKALEYGKAATNPKSGHTVKSAVAAMASTVTESNSGNKVGREIRREGINPANGTLDRSRVDSSGKKLTTNQGVEISDNQNSLKAGLRGPTLMEDFVLREKITHFDHERIPERIVHARGSGAHGYFECYKPLTEYTKASLFSKAGKRTPVFVRFSTVAGERGSTDTARDARGFAVKFYTEEGNFDLVGNNIPVFFIQDAMKFPDLIHAVKPEPHNGMPQAASAHDTFWDFISLMPESTHMMMWVMSDRAIPRSYRMMQGFGVHTFRLVNEGGESWFVKFHWNPVLGTHSLLWDEAVRISGADPDFHRRDLWEAIESGNYPEFELGMQIFTEEQAEKFSFDILDPTKIVPEELVPVQPVGRLVLNRNPDNFFAETEQVAFCAAHIVPGLDFSNDPLLAGRIHSYVDTQITRLGGANFHEIPVNAPLAPAHNNQRDGMHRQAINRGRVAYEPNSLGGGCPFQAGAKGFTSFPQPIGEDKVRGKPEKFADHYTQALLFWNSQTAIEKNHLIDAFRFELTKVQVPSIRQRMLASLANVADELAKSVAEGLGMTLPRPLPKVLQSAGRPEVNESPALSLFSRPGDGSIKARRIAILIVDGVDAEAVNILQDGLSKAGAVPRLVSFRLGQVKAKQGRLINVDATLETEPSVLFDAVVVPGGKDVPEFIGNAPAAMDFIKDQYRHCKPVFAINEGVEAVKAAGISATLESGGIDAGVVLVEKGGAQEGLAKFIQAVAKHRHFSRLGHGLEDE